MLAFEVKLVNTVKCDWFSLNSVHSTATSAFHRNVFRRFTKKLLSFMLFPNPLSKNGFTSPNHSFEFLRSVSWLSVRGSIAQQRLILQKTWHLRWWSRAAIELLWSSTYWGAFESDSLEWRALCQGSHLQNTTQLRAAFEAKTNCCPNQTLCARMFFSFSHMEDLLFGCFAIKASTS